MTGEWLPPQPLGGHEPPQPPPEYPHQPAPGYAPPGYQRPGWQAPPPQPPNNEAVAGFTCGIIGISLLFFTAGLSTIVSLILGIVAIPYARKGKRNVDEGRTLKHKSLASAGFVIGIVTVVLSVLATITWVLLLALVDWDEIDDSDDDPFDGDPFDGQFQSAVFLRLAASLIRLFA